MAESVKVNSNSLCLSRKGYVFDVPCDSYSWHPVDGMSTSFRLFNFSGLESFLEGMGEGDIIPVFNDKHLGLLDFLRDAESFKSDIMKELLSGEGGGIRSYNPVYREVENPCNYLNEVFSEGLFSKVSLKYNSVSIEHSVVTAVGFSFVALSENHPGLFTIRVNINSL